MSLFDFNYYYGGASSSGWVDKTLPTFVGIIIGFAINKGYDFFKEQDSIKKAGHEFINELELFEEPLLKQIKSIDELVEKLKDPETVDINLIGYMQVDMDRVNLIDRLYVYKYFKKVIKNNPVEARRVVNKLYGNIKICSMEGERLKNLYNTVSNERCKESKAFNLSINELLGSFSNLITNLEKEKKSVSEDNLYNELSPIFKVLRDPSNPVSIDEIVTKVCNPIVKVTAKYRLDDRVLDFFTNNRQCFKHYREHNAIKEDFIDELENIKSVFSQSHTQIGALLKQYNLRA